MVSWSVGVLTFSLASGREETVGDQTDAGTLRRRRANSRQFGGRSWRSTVRTVARVTPSRRLHMATNLVSQVLQFLTPDLIGRIAAALGLNSTDVLTGITAAWPTLLAALTGLAEKPGVAQNLVDTIKQQSGVLDNFSRIVGGAGQSSFIDKGSSMLTSLLGGEAQSALAGA